MNEKKKVVLSGFIGNALEFYDFTLCGVFLQKISSLFFPSTNPSLTVLGGLFAFSAAFYSRPLGGLLFGHIGDKFGRKTALMISILLMGVPTSLMGLLPSYQSVGLIAPLLLVLCRFLQGLSAGGEYNGAAIFSMEHNKDQPGTVSGLISSSCVVGAISATLVGYVVSLSSYEEAWRIPFFLGGIISLIGFYIRFSLRESQECHQEPVIPILCVVKEHKKSLLQALSIGFTNGALSYTIFGFLVLYLSRYLEVKLSVSFLYNIFGLGTFMMCCPIFGKIGDRIGAVPSILLANIIALIFSPLAFFLMQMGSLSSIIFGQIVMGMIVGSFVGPTHFFLQKLFPPSVRYTGISFGFSLGMGLAGGTVQMIFVFLLDLYGNLYIPCLVLMVNAVMCLLVNGLSFKLQGLKFLKVRLQTQR